MEIEKLMLRLWWSLYGKSDPERPLCLCWQHPTLWKSDLQIYSKYSQEKISKISFIRKLGRIKILCIREIRVKTFTFLNEIFFYLAYKPQLEQGEATVVQKSEHRMDFGLLASKWSGKVQRKDDFQTPSQVMQQSCEP